MKRQVSFKLDESAVKFYFINFGKGENSFRLWISSKFVTQDESGIECIEFPVKNSELVKTEKGNYVLKQGKGITYNLFCLCGFKGSSEIEVIEPEPDAVVEYKIPKGKNGYFGVSSGKLVWFKKMIPVTYKWKRVGKNVKQPEGVVKLGIDGNSVNDKNKQKVRVE